MNNATIGRRCQVMGSGAPSLLEDLPCGPLPSPMLRALQPGVFSLFLQQASFVLSQDFSTGSSFSFIFTLFFVPCLVLFAP